MQRKHWMMAAILMIVLGCGIAGSTLAIYWGQWSRFNTDEAAEAKRQETFSASALRITGSSEDIVLRRSRDDEVHVTAYEREDEPFSMAVDESGRLTITGPQHNGQLISLMLTPDRAEPELQIELPEKFDAVMIETASGDVELESLTLQDALTIGTVSGDVVLRDLTAESLELRTTSGDLELEKTSAAAATLLSVSGEIELERLALSELLAVKTTSGDVDVSRTSVTGDITVKTVSGEIVCALQGSADDYTVTTETTSGEVEADRSGRGRWLVELETTSGDIELKFVGGEGQRR